MLNHFSKKSLLLLGMSLGFTQLYASTKTENLSLADLLNIEVDAGNLTGLKGNKVPVPITVITKKDIARTPYNTLIDLIEVYAPGAFQVSHQLPLLGMRGTVVDRNYKWLLLVNGRLMNQRAAEGAVEEIRHYNLDDVERVEVIRGPGSVTYGPGAVSGVINIVTKTGENVDGFEVTSGYDQAYNRKNAGVGYGYQGDDVEAYFYASTQYQDGADADYYRLSNKSGEFGIMGVDVDTANTPQPYQVSVEDEPFIKLHMDVKAFEDWRFWARYTRANGAQNVANMNLVDYDYDGAPTDIPTRFSKIQSFTAALENKTELSDWLTISTLASFKTHDYLLASSKIDTLPYYFGIADFKGEPENGNAVYSFAEHEGFFKSILNFNFNKDYKAALGGSMSFQSFANSWDGGNQYAIFQPKTVKNENGEYYADLERYGYGTMMGSIFGEANLGFHPLATALLSMRIDKHQWSEFFFSPRVGIISEINENNVAKLFWQRSLRMNTTSDMFREFVNGDKSKPEELSSIEGSYITSPIEDVQGKFYLYYNTLDVLGWNANTNATELVGKMKSWGAEGEVNYENEDFKVGLNHTLTSMISWENAEGVTSQGISAADYDKQVDSLHMLKSTGNSLNNVPQQITKFIATVNLPYDLWVHGDMGIQWGYQGYKDVITMYSDMLGDDATWAATKAKLEDEDYAGIEVRMNLSLGYNFEAAGFNGGVMIYGQNLLEQNTHTYSSGNKTLYPEKLQYIVEPRTFGVRVNVNY